MVTEHPATIDPERLLGECEVNRARRSGPGGQHRNKVETAVVLHHRPTGLQAEAGERRSQVENQRVALFRLRLKLAVHHRSPSAAETPPSPLWRGRCRNGRLSVNPSHEDYPAMLAEAMDAIASHDHDLRKVAECLGTTSSQLVKLLKDEPQALAQLNQIRKERNQAPLR